MEIKKGGENMKVQISDVMRKYLQKNFKEYRFSLEKMSIDEYKIRVDYRFEWHVRDYDFTRNVMKAIRVEYPAEYYAMPRYLTTNDLTSAFVASNKTENGFLKAIQAIIEI